MTHWATDENRLSMSTPTMDRDTRDMARRGRMADNQRIRAYRAGNQGRPWEHGDPGRKGQPWRPFCRELWEQGGEDRRLWQLEDRQTREREAREKFERAEAKARARRRKQRAEQAWKTVRVVLGPRRTRKLRRWRKRWNR